MEVNNMNFFEKCSHIKSKLIVDYSSCVKPVLSIVIPTYKRSNAVKALLTSIEFETMIKDDRLEIVVVDNDGGGDNSSELFDYIKKCKNLPIRYFKNEENIGMASNWNRCFEVARGNWVFMIHADDLLVEGSIAFLFRIIEDYSDIYDIIYTGRKTQRYSIKSIEKNDITIKQQKKFAFIDYSKIDFELGTAIVAPTGLLAKRDVVIKLGGFNNEKSAFALDVEFTIKSMKEYKVTRVNRVCVIKREGENDTETSTKAYRMSWVNSIFDLYEQYDMFSKSFVHIFLMEMRFVKICEWASVTIKDTKYPYHFFCGLKISKSIYNMITRLYRKIRFI